MMDPGGRELQLAKYRVEFETATEDQSDNKQNRKHTSSDLCSTTQPFSRCRQLKVNSYSQQGKEDERHSGLGHGGSLFDYSLHHGGVEDFRKPSEAQFSDLLS